MRPPQGLHRYAWLTVLILVLPVVALAIGVAVFTSAESYLVARTGGSLAVAATEIADKVDHFLYERFGDIHMMAQAPVFRGVDTAAKRKLLEAYKTTYDPFYLWLVVTDANGRVVASSNRSAEGGLYSRASWFQAVRHSGAVYVGDAEPFGETGGLHAVTFSAPLLGSRGEFLGAVATKVGIHDLQEVIIHTVRVVQAQQRLPGQVGFLFLRRTGEVIIDTEHSYEASMNLKQAGLPSALLSNSTKPGYIEEDHLRRHMPVVTGYALTQGYKEFKGLQWSILIRVDRRDILTPYRTILWQVAGVGSALWALVFAIVLWTSVRLRTEHQAVLQEHARATAAAAASRASEKQTRLLIDTALDAVVGMDEDGTITEWNRSAQSIFGWAQQEAIGNRLADLLIPLRFREAHLNGLRHFLAGGDAPHLNRRLKVVALRRDGGEFPIELKISALKTSDSFKFVAFIDDISERNKMEQERTQLLNHMRLLLESTGEGIYGVDMEGRCTFVNRAAAGMLGYCPDELITRQMHEVIHHSHRDRSLYPVEKCAINTVFESGRECRSENQVFWRRDGTAFPVEYAAHPIIDQGTIQGAVVSFVDISPRKQAEAAFREQSRLLEIFFRYTQTAIVFLDRNFNFIRVNESYARACQRHASEFPGHNHFELYPSDAQKIFEEVRATKVPYHAVAHPFVFPDHPEWGVTYWDWTLIPVLDASEEVDLFVFSLNNVTGRKYAEDALQKRTLQLRNMLEERERLCQDLHDNIIQTVYAVGMGLEACRDLVTKDPEGVGNRLRQSVGDLNRVIRDVRSYIAGERPALWSGKQFSSELARLIRTMCGGRLHGSRLRLDHGAVALLTAEEATHLLFIAREAISNCLRHSGAKSITLSLRVQDRRLCFEVQDDGCGFEVQKRSQGRGHGLHNIEARAKQLDAQIHLSSGPGQGTRLSIELKKEHVGDAIQNG